MNQRFGGRRSGFDNTFKRSGVPVSESNKWSDHSYTAQYLRSSLRQHSVGEFRFELDGVAMVVNCWFDVIYREKTGCK